MDESGGEATEQERTEAELRQLRDRLADAWWYEESLETIQALEREIKIRWQRLCGENPGAAC